VRSCFFRSRRLDQPSAGACLDHEEPPTSSLGLTSAFGRERAPDSPDAKDATQASWFTQPAATSVRRGACGHNATSHDLPGGGGREQVTRAHVLTTRPSAGGPTRSACPRETSPRRPRATAGRRQNGADRPTRAAPRNSSKHDPPRSHTTRRRGARSPAPTAPVDDAHPPRTTPTQTPRRAARDDLALTQPRAGRSVARSRPGTCSGGVGVGRFVSSGV
jgi:hypothetical protein